MGEVVIRRATAPDREMVLELIRNMVAEDAGARFSWIYEGNPHGRAVTCLALDAESGEPLGCTSVFPRRVLAAGRERTGSIGGDCWIVPKARRRGLATALHRASLDAMRESGIEFLYGAPVVNNLRALLKAGSRIVTTFDRWIRPLDARGLARAVAKSEAGAVASAVAQVSYALLDRATRVRTSAFELRPVERFGEEFDSLYERASAPRVVSCVRDARYLAWRYLEGPTRRQQPFALRSGGRLAGFIALEFAGAQASIVDLFTEDDPEIAAAALQLAIDRTAAMGCHWLDLQCTVSAADVAHPARRGFIKRPGHPFQVTMAGEQDEQDPVLRGDAWHYLTADVDADTALSYRADVA